MREMKKIIKENITINGVTYEYLLEDNIRLHYCEWSGFDYITIDPKTYYEIYCVPIVSKLGEIICFEIIRPITCSRIEKR